MKSVLTQEFIGSNVLIDSNEYFIISGVDGFKILVYKDNGGGVSYPYFATFCYHVSLYFTLCCLVFLRLNIAETKGGIL